MIKLKSLLNHQWFFPILMLYYGVFYILLGEIYPFNGGLSTDGYVFSTFIPDFKTSGFFDAYYVHRILPSFIVSEFFKLFSIKPIISNIFFAYQILNVISLILACYFLKRILILFKITFKNQLLAFALFVLNFGIIKYPFYLPVMTDTFALMLSTLLLYYYLKNNISGLIISTLLLAFTWPMAYYQGLLLIAIPFSVLSFTTPLKWQKKLVYGVSVLYILALSIIFVYIQNIDITVSYVIRIDKVLLPLSIFGSVLIYFFFAKIFFNKTLLDIPLFFKKLNYKRILISFSVFAIVFLTVTYLNPRSSSLYSTAQTLRDPTIYALIKPLIAIVADVSFWGILVCLLIIFWSSFCKTVSQMGWGLVAALALNLFLFGITPQSRHLINILPWLVVFLVKSINKYSFSNRFYIVVGLLCFVGSKIWFLLNNNEGYPPMQLDKNGSMGFPHQKLWMNIGPWMSEQMYYVQAGVMLVFMVILFFTLYKVKRDEFDKLQLVRKFQIIK